MLAALSGAIAEAFALAFAATLRSATETGAALIFLRLAENSAGESDLSLFPDASAGSLPLLNYTYINQGVSSPEGSQWAAGASARWLALAKAHAADEPSHSTSAFILAIDSEKEAQIGLGRLWEGRQLGRDECYVTTSALDEIGLQGGRGDRVELRLSLQALLGAFGGSSGQAAADGQTSDGAQSGGGDSLPLSVQLLVALGILDANALQVGGTVTLDEATADALLAGSLGVDSGQVDLIGLVEALGGAAADDDAIPFRVNSDGSVVLPADPIIASIAAAETAALATANAAISLDANGDLSLTKVVTVVDSIDEPLGKFPLALGNVALLEAEELAVWLRDSVLEAVTAVEESLNGNPAAGGFNLTTQFAQLREQVGQFDYATMQQYAMQVDVMFADRVDFYVEAGDNVQSASWHRADRIMSAVEFGTAAEYDPATDSPDARRAVQSRNVLPLATGLAGTRFIRLFLDQVFLLVIFTMALLGTMVIYSLILGDVNAKTFEFGMLRALGMRHQTLAQVLSYNTVVFAVPGILVGLFLAELLNLAVAAVLQAVAAVRSPLWLTPSSVLLAVLLGTIVPSLANVVPVRRALGGSLRDALSLYSASAINAITVTVTRLARLGLSPAQLVLALTLIAVGLVTFIFVPLTFVEQRFDMFLFLLTLVLLAMLLGLALLSQLVQPAVEWAVLQCSVCGAQRRLLTVVRKNLAGHRPRNRKTAYLLTITVAFVIFSGSMLALQARSITENARLFLGADVFVLAPLPEEATAAGGPYALPEADLRAYLDGQKESRPDGSPGFVEDYSFVSHAIWDFPTVIGNRLSSLSNFPAPRSVVYGVEPNYLRVTYSEYARVFEEAQSDSVLAGPVPPSGSSEPFARRDVVEKLFDGAGANRLPTEDIGGSIQANWTTEQLLAAAPPLALSGVTSPLFWVCNGTAATGYYLDDASCEAECRQGGGQGAAAWDYLLQEDVQSVGNLDQAVGRAAADEGQHLCSRIGGSTAVSRSEREQALTYTRYVDVIATEALRGYAAIEASTPLRLFHAAYLEESRAYKATSRLAKARAMVGRFPGFFFSTYRQSAPMAPLLTPMGQAAGLKLAGELAVQQAIADGNAAIVSRDDAEDLEESVAVGGAGREAQGVDDNPSQPTPGSAVSEDSTGSDGVNQQAAVEAAFAAAWTALVQGTAGGNESTRAEDAAVDEFGRPYADPAGLAKQSVLVRLRDGVSAKQRSLVLNGLRTVVNDDTVFVQSTPALLEATATALLGMRAFFVLVAILSMILCFFAAWLSFSANIQENSREFGVMRALGLTQVQVISCYIYEAVAVLTSSFVLGTVIGMLVAASLTLQFNLFTQAAFIFDFPTAVFVTLVVITAAVSFLASFLPARRLGTMEIAHVLKGRS